MERPGATTLRGNPMTLIGPELKSGDKAPDFDLVSDTLQPVNLEKTGKAVGKDAAAGKATLVSLRGVEGAKAEARRLAERAAGALAPFGGAAAVLQALPFHLLDRAS